MDNLLIDKNVKIQHTYCYQYSKSKEFSLKKKIKCNNLLKYLSLNFVQSFLSPLPLNQNKTKKQKNKKTKKKQKTKKYVCYPLSVVGLVDKIF